MIKKVEKMEDNTVDIIKRKQIREVKNLIEELSSLSEKESEIGYFINKTENAFLENSKQIFNKKVIGTLCINVPEELIYAAGAIPIRICSGSSVLDQIGSENYPTKSCPLVKSVVGSIKHGAFYNNLKPKLIINPTTCDQKKKIVEVVADTDFEIYHLEVPSSKTSELSQKFWLHSINDLKEKIESFTGNKITNAALKRSIGMVIEAQTEFHKLINIRANHNVIWGSEVILIANTYFFDEINEWTENLRLLNEQLDKKAKSADFICPQETPRILITGSPSILPNLKLPLLIEKSGAIIVADEFCSSNRLLYDFVAVDEWRMYDMIPALADKYLKPNTCPNFTPNEDRKRKLANMVDEFKVDGIIYQTLSGCQLFDIETVSVGEYFRNKSVPILFIETDYNPDDSGQLSTRVEAFIDSIKNKKIK